MLTLPGLPTLSLEHAKRCIPHTQLEAFNRETEAGRKYVLDWISILEPLRHAKGRTKLFPLVARQIGDQPGNVKRRYYAYIAGLKGEHDLVWEGLIDRARFPRPGDHCLDERFLEYWRGLREQQRRLNDGGRQAHRDLIAQLTLWEARPHDPKLRLPGYTEVPARDSYCADRRCRVPSGWSYRNLSRHNPRRIELVNIIVGPKAASTLLPSNLGTREGLGYRQILLTDDQDLDQRIASPYTRGEILRPQGFNILDYLTGAWESYGIQFRRRDEEGHQRGINQEFYVWLVLGDLVKNGFRDDDRGTLIIREHATAKGYTKKDGHGDSFDDLLHHITGGRVSFDASGRFDQPAFAQLFLGSRSKQSSGNFRYKGPIESAFRAVRTRSAGLLGDTGLNERMVGPEANETISRYELQLFKAIDKLPPADRHAVYDLLRHPVHTQHEFAVLYSLIYRALDARRDHSIEGWSRCGFVLPALHYTLPNQKADLVTRDQFAIMTSQQQQMLEAFGEWRPIHLSPTEARAISRQRDRHVLRKLSWSAALHAIPVSWAYPLRRGKSATALKVKPNGTIVIHDPERFGPDGLVYLAILHTGQDRIHLRPGESVMLHVCPFDPDEALALDPQGRYRGTVKLMPRICAADREARLRSQGTINEYAADIRRGSERRAEPEFDRQRGDIDHNGRVVSGEITPTDEALAQSRYDYDLQRYHADDDAGIISVEPTPAWETEDHHAPAAAHDPYANIFANDPDLDSED